MAEGVCISQIPQTLGSEQVEDAASGGSVEFMPGGPCGEHVLTDKLGQGKEAPQAHETKKEI